MRVLKREGGYGKKSRGRGAGGGAREKGECGRGGGARSGAGEEGLDRSVGVCGPTVAEGNNAEMGAGVGGDGEIKTLTMNRDGKAVVYLANAGRTNC